MKINQPSVKAFTPITLTIESEGELAFLVRIFGATIEEVDMQFNLASRNQLATYHHLLSLIESDIDNYPSLTLLTNY